MFTQVLLHTELARRVRAANAGLNGRPAPATDLPDLTQLADAEENAPDVAVIAVLHHFDLATFARSALEFALGVGAEERDAWFRAFTRTLFLAGNPVNLAGRFRFNHIAADGSVAWFGPTSTTQSTGLRRLLKRLDGTVAPNPPAALTLDVPGASGGQLYRLYVATAGVAMADYLVHLNHVLAEAVLTKAVKPGDRLLLHHVPRLGSAVAPYQALRVHRDSYHPTRLRAYACLST
ncbi:MAG TPA: DUF6182 family protein [Streptosporangiaceae bacterium]|nr:DUF6182 family protein [Streptosporangiaceae bacterium]